MPAEAYIDDIPQEIREAFRGKLFLTTPAVAKVLGLNIGTVREHIREGNLPWRQKGTGKVAPKLAHTLSDVAVLWRHMTEASARALGVAGSPPGTVVPLPLPGRRPPADDEFSTPRTPRRGPRNPKKTRRRRSIRAPD